MDETEGADAESPYFRHFRDHLQQVQGHLCGSHGTLDPSYHPPRGYWTSAEKGQFFHGLCVYSRFRPDLIAADIATKSILDVCTYISSLEEASGRENAKKRTRDVSETAMEVSDDWIAFEEQQAQLLMQIEEHWAGQTVENARKATLREWAESLYATSTEQDKPKRETVRKRVKLELKKEWDKEDCLRALSGPHLQVMDGILKVEDEDATGSAQMRNVSSDGHTPASTVAASVTVLDAMIDPALLAISTPTAVSERIAEQSPKVTSSSPSMAVPSNVAERTSAQPIPAVVPPFTPVDMSQDVDSEVDVSSLSPRSRRRHQKRMYMRRKRAEASGRSASATVSRLKPGRKGKGKPSAANDTDTAGVDEENTEPTGACTQNVPLQQTVHHPATNDSSNLLDNVPFTMDEDEEDDVDDFDVYAGKEEYEPTLEAAAKAPPTAAGFQQGKNITAFLVGEAPGPSHYASSSSQKKPKQRGLTLPYKIKARLTEHGYNAKALRVMGLGLFHLSRLGKLMELVTTLHEDVDLEDADANICTSISSDTIQSLHAHVVAFVTDLLGRVIALREHEHQSKGHTKVWRKRDFEVTAPCVRKALRSMNASADKYDRLEGLALQVHGSDEETFDDEQDRVGRERRGGQNSSECDSDDAEQKQNEREDVNGEEDSDASALSVFQELYMPFIFGVPSMPSDPCVDSSSLVRHSNGSKNLDELLEFNSDEDDALEVELHEEDELDELDLEASKRAEEELWEELREGDSADEDDDELEEGRTGRTVMNRGHSKAAVASDDISSHFLSRKRRNGDSVREKRSSKESKPSRLLRFAPPDATGMVKSAVYIEGDD